MTLADRVVVLNRGAVEQIGTPEELYKTPANQFVASFIGSPLMNLFDAQVRRGKASSREGVEITMPVDWSGDAVIGVRPDHIDLSDGGISASVKWVEQLGAHCLVGVQVGDRDSRLYLRLER